MHTVGLGISRETLKKMENEKHTLGLGIWQETLKQVENEKLTLQDLEYGEKTDQEGILETNMV